MTDPIKTDCLIIGAGPVGLFAVFAILRYRTDPIPIKEMTYLFTVITTGVINAMGSNQVSYSELLFANFIILFLTFILEKQSNGKQNIENHQKQLEKLEND